MPVPEDETKKIIACPGPIQTNARGRSHLKIYVYREGIGKRTCAKVVPLRRMFAMRRPTPYRINANRDFLPMMSVLTILLPLTSARLVRMTQIIVRRMVPMPWGITVPEVIPLLMGWTLVIQKGQAQVVVTNVAEDHIHWKMTVNMITLMNVQHFLMFLMMTLALMAPMLDVEKMEVTIGVRGLGSQVMIVAMEQMMQIGAFRIARTMVLTMLVQGGGRR